MVGIMIATPNPGETAVVFTAGMQVRLKSGGPPMTVAAAQDATVTCIWFDKNTLRERDFPAETIEQKRDVVGEILEQIKREKTGEGDTL
jgi:uncharacterized protein YodC (DUF2158 family)